MHRVERSDKLPPCSRCGGRPLTSVVMPQDDAAGRPIHLQLCPACDAGKPAASALLHWLTSGGGHDPSRAEEGARLLLAWTKEGMADHGWTWLGSISGDAPPPSGPVPDADVERQLMNPGTPGNLTEIEHLQQQRDALRERLATEPAKDREELRKGIRELGRAIAEALAAADVTAEALRAEAPKPRPGPLSPEAEQEILGLFRQLSAKQEDDGTERPQAESDEGDAGSDSN
ncbi:DUF6300 family protein [Streptomyces triculaminicus]|uniref:DUF6300 family protein n=1 Tax=Streptomyces triculaminicus TaxID=2816232 RepID=UPI0037CD042A